MRWKAATFCLIFPISLYQRFHPWNVLSAEKLSRLHWIALKQKLLLNVDCPAPVTIWRVAALLWQFDKLVLLIHFQQETSLVLPMSPSYWKRERLCLNSESARSLLCWLTLTKALLPSDPPQWPNGKVLLSSLSVSLRYCATAVVVKLKY